MDHTRNCDKHGKKESSWVHLYMSTMRFLGVVHTSDIIGMNILWSLRLKRFWICFTGRSTLAIAWNDNGKEECKGSVNEIEMNTYCEMPEEF
jgi:hypothetical protein